MKINYVNIIKIISLGSNINGLMKFFVGFEEEPSWFEKKFFLEKIKLRDILYVLIEELVIIGQLLDF